MEKYTGPERRNHICYQEEKLGKLEEFMSVTKGLKATLFTITMAIVLQVGGFLYIWGGLTEVVKKNTNQVWEKLTPATYENTRNIDKILTTFELMKGKQGIQGKDGKP